MINGLNINVIIRSMFAYIYIYILTKLNKLIIYWYEFGILIVRSYNIYPNKY
jgi:hypothetical protein